MNASIKLTKLVGDPANSPAMRTSWPLTIQATGLDIPDEIFVYQMGNPSTGQDRFSCVASVSQMEEIPKYNGRTLTSELGVPFYRTAQMTVICRNPAELERVWRIAQEHTQALIENWNAAWALKGVDRVTIDEETVNQENLSMNPPQLITLASRPAGTATLVSEVQGITSPDAALSGWLPVSSAPPAWTVPPGALFYYNLDEDAALKKLWPLPEPVSGNLLHRNGLLLPYGITHVYNKHTIWWLAFSPANLPGYKHIDGQVQDGNAPWPLDFVNAQHPGEVTPQLTLTVFAEAA